MMDTTGSTPPLAVADETLQRNWYLFLLMGIVLAVVGLLAATSYTLEATLVGVLWLGISLVVGGVIQIVGAFYFRRSDIFLLNLLFGVLYAVVGVVLIDHPVAAAAAITLVIAAALIVNGLLRIAAAMTTRFDTWMYFVLTGIISLFLGMAIWRQWPDDSRWVIGLFVGVEMLLTGCNWIMLGIMLRSEKKA